MANAHAENSSGKKEIWRVTIILSVLTIIELLIGYFMIGMEESFFRHFLKGVIIILMLAKAFYIVAYFMHLGHELRNMITCAKLVVSQSLSRTENKGGFYNENLVLSEAVL